MTKPKFHIGDFVKIRKCKRTEGYHHHDCIGIIFDMDIIDPSEDTLFEDEYYVRWLHGNKVDNLINEHNYIDGIYGNEDLAKLDSITTTNRTKSSPRNKNK